MPRNRELMRVFKDVGLVEQLGSGMSRILRAYDKDIFQISDHFIKVVFPFAEPLQLNQNAAGIEVGTDAGIDNGTDKILALLAEYPEMTIKELSAQLECSVRKVNRMMKELRESGKITRIGSDRKGVWQINQ